MGSAAAARWCPRPPRKRCLLGMLVLALAALPLTPLYLAARPFFPRRLHLAPPYRVRLIRCGRGRKRLWRAIWTGLTRILTFAKPAACVCISEHRSGGGFGERNIGLTLRR